MAPAVVGAAPPGFIILAAGLVTIDIVIVACGNRSRKGVLSQAGINKTTECDPRQRHSQSESNLRKHGRDEKELFPVMQAFLLHFCNVPAGRHLVARFPRVPSFDVDAC
jgi:hypothetical protein